MSWREFDLSLETDIKMHHGCSRQHDSFFLGSETEGTSLKGDCFLLSGGYLVEKNVCMVTADIWTK